MITNSPLTLSPTPLSNFAANAAIGTAENTVDRAASVAINQTTAGITLTIPDPTVTTPGKIFIVVNTGTQSVTVGGKSVSPSTFVIFVWSGSAWLIEPSVGGGTWYSNWVPVADGTTDTTEAIRRTGKITLGSDANDGQKLINSVTEVANATGVGISLEHYSSDNGIPLIETRKAQGTKAAPVAINQYRNMFNVKGQGHDGTTFQNGGGILLLSHAAAWSPTNRGSAIVLQTIAPNTTAVTNSHMFCARTNATAVSQNVANASVPAGVSVFDVLVTDTSVVNVTLPGSGSVNPMNIPPGFQLTITCALAAGITIKAANTNMGADFVLANGNAAVFYWSLSKWMKAV